MMSKAKIAILQMDVVWEQPEANHEKLLGLLEKIPQDVNLFVLPELWSSCYSAPFLESASLISPQLLDSLCQWCRDHFCWSVAGSLPWKEEEKLFNRSWVITDAGTTAGFYDKMHLFSLTHENELITPGISPLIFEMNGITCAVIICYDLRFPELARALTLAGVELLFVVAQWPQRRIDAWKILLQAAAVENQLFVVGCNRCGVADVPYGGQSMAVSPWGEKLVSSENTEAVLYAELDLAEVKKARKRMPFLKDRRPELYTLISS